MAWLRFVAPAASAAAFLPTTFADTDCAAPVGIANAYPAGACTEGNSIQDGQFCTAHCAEGFLPNSLSLQCVAGRLQPQEFVCEPRACWKTPLVSRGTVTCTGTVTDDGALLGTVCEVQCQAGYKLDGARSSTCFLSPDVSDGSLPIFSPLGSCRARMCGSLSLSSPYLWVVPQDTGVGLLGVQRMVSCLEGYRWEPVTSSDAFFEAFECRPVSNASEADVLWVSDRTCVLPSSCGPPPQVAQDSLAIWRCSGYGEGSVCNIECSRGFQAGTGGIQCLTNGSWQDPTDPSHCRPASCGRPQIGDLPFVQEITCLEAGILQENQSTTSPIITSESTCEIQCETGYFPTGSYHCRQGAFIEIPSCFPQTTQVRTVYALFGFMEIEVDQNVEIQQSLKTSIADALVDVTAVDVSTVFEQTLPSPPPVVVEFSVRTCKGSSFAQEQLARISAPGFANHVKMGLEVRIPGVQVNISVASHIQLRTQYEDGSTPCEASTTGSGLQASTEDDSENYVPTFLGIMGALLGGLSLLGAAVGIRSWMTWAGTVKDSELSFEGLVATIDSRAAKDGKAFGTDKPRADEREDWVARFYEPDRQVDYSGEAAILASIPEDARREAAQAEAHEANPETPGLPTTSSARSPGVQDSEVSLSVDDESPVTVKAVRASSSDKIMRSAKPEQPGDMPAVALEEDDLEDELQHLPAVPLEEDPLEEEERRIANDGNSYTKAEFQEHYKEYWHSKWNAAEVAIGSTAV